MKIVVTGGCGYIGGSLAHCLLSEGHSITVLDDFSNSSPESDANRHIVENQNSRVVNGSILDKLLLERLFEQFKPDAVFHLAAIKSVEFSENQPDLVDLVNFEGTKNVVNACLRSNVKRLIFSSTAGVYKDGSQMLKETSRLSPDNPYAKSKMKAEQLLESVYLNQEDLKCLTLRFFNPIGVYRNIVSEDLKSRYGGVVTKIVKSLQEQERFLLQSFVDCNGDMATGIRDYVDIRDLVNCMSSIGLNFEPVYEVANVGAGVGVSTSELVKMFEEISCQPVLASNVEYPQGLPRFSVCNTEKIAKKYGFSPKYSIRDSIEVICKYYLENSHVS